MSPNGVTRPQWVKNRGHYWDDTMDNEVMNGQTDKWTRWINILPLIHHRRYKYNNSNSPHCFLAATKQLYEWCSWVLYRQLELTKLTRPDLHHVVGLFILRDVCPSVCLSHHFHYVPITVSSWNFQELLPLTEVMSIQKVKVKVRGQSHRGQNLI